MSYAVRNDLLGWRAVNSESDVGEDEHYCVNQPPPTESAPPTPHELAADAVGSRDQLLGLAAIRIAPLQDAIDEDSATDNEVARLKLWKQYRIALNRVELQAGYPSDIEWPVSPDSA